MPELAELPAFEFTGAASIPADLLDRSRASAEAIGYANGWARGVREAKESMAAQAAAAQAEIDRGRSIAAQQITIALSGLAAAAGALEASAAAEAESLEPALMAAAVTIAEALVGHQLRDIDAATRSAMARMVQLAPRDEPTTIRINTTAYAALGEIGISELLAGVDGASGRELTVEPDDTLGIGEATARHGATTIDGRLAAGIERIRQELAGQAG